MLTDTELLLVREYTGIFSLGIWARLYSLVCERAVSPNEVDDAHARLSAAYWRDHPAEKAEHDRRVQEFAALERATTSFWRSAPPNPAR